MNAGSEEPDDDWRLGVRVPSTGCNSAEPDTEQHAAFHANDLYGIYDSLASIPQEAIAANSELQPPKDNEISPTTVVPETPSVPSGTSGPSGQEEFPQPSAVPVPVSAADTVAAEAVAAAGAPCLSKEADCGHGHHDGQITEFSAATPTVQSILRAGRISGAIPFPCVLLRSHGN